MCLRVTVLLMFGFGVTGMLKFVLQGDYSLDICVFWVTGMLKFLLQDDWNADVGVSGWLECCCLCLRVGD